MNKKYLLSALLLTGCLSTDPASWSQQPDAQTAVKAAIYECEQDATAVVNRAAAFGGAVVPIAGLFGMRRTFNQCMAARGFVR